MGDRFGNAGTEMLAVTVTEAGAYHVQVRMQDTGGTFTVIVRPLADSKVDLVLEVYVGHNMNEPAIESDQIAQNNPANESATVDIPAGRRS